MSPVISRLESKPETLDNFTQIYVSYMPYVLSYFRTYPMDVQQAEDLTQEVFVIPRATWGEICPISSK